MDPWTLVWMAVIGGFLLWAVPRLRGLLILAGSLMLAGALFGTALANGYGTGTGIRSHPKVTQLAKANIPAPALQQYRSTGDRYGVAWTVLAAIGEVETDHCQSTAPGVRSGENHAGAGGCMQFLSGTWAQYGRGGSRYRLKDSIPAAARLLKANGYGDKVPRPGYRRCPGVDARPGTINALRHYNNACWYVAKVLAWSERYRTGRFS